MTANDSPIKPITVIAASAGTGKTYTLSREYLRGLSRISEIQNLGGQSSIMATTFTNKAADELIERVRRVLLQEGQWQAAQSVLGGYLGTVNSLCGRLLSEHAIEAGLSPDLTVIGEERLPAVFAIAVDSVVHEFAEEMNEAATRLQMENWRKDVLSVIDAARNNNLDADSLEQLADESWSSLKALLDPLDGTTGEELDAQLATAIESVLPLLPATQDYTKKTYGIVEDLGEVNRRIKSGAKLFWPFWAKLSKLKPGKGSRDVIKPIIDAASAHTKHPRLHEDLETTIYGVFRCAALAMQKYADYKKEHGLIDFVDQELLTLHMLRKPEISESLAQKIQVLLVDEFQDTSPIQLAIFLELAKLVDYSVWVGDEKQSIFSFRGSDPELMRQSIAQLVRKTGGKKFRLAKSYRSRPTLVKFTNELFSRCDEIRHITTDSAIIEEVDRTELDGQNNALHFWWLGGSRVEQNTSCLAQGISHILDNAEQWLVVDRDTKILRPIRGSDIVILCRFNDHRIKTARALVSHGLTVATERDALLDTPECVLACAALRILVDRSDSLAIAELVNLLCPETGDWLTEVIAMRGNPRLETWLKGLSENENLKADRALACLCALKKIREELSDRTPLEILESAINSDELLEAIVSWGNVRQRLANLDSLRGLARAYEEICKSSRLPASAPGLILYLYKFIEDGGSQPANPDENGIHILTYHKAKGLEWPMVILSDLDKYHRGSPFGITVETNQSELDPLNPLEGRKIRYWPWPYPGHYNDLKLRTKAEKTAESRRAVQRATAENLRLLYVGMTRARDYLIFSARPNPNGTVWLKQLTESESEYRQAILSLPCDQQPFDRELIDGVPESLTHFVYQDLPQSVTREKDSAQTYTQARTERRTTEGNGLTQPRLIEPHLIKPYLLKPSEAGPDDFSVVFGERPETIIIGSRVNLHGSPDMQLVGDCVHAYLCAERTLCSGEQQVHTRAPEEDRLLLASQMLSNFAVDALPAEALPEMARRLNEFIVGKHPGATLHNEVPISGRLDLRRVRGSIDLLLELPGGYVIIDHKTFPGRFEEWESRALSYAPQLALYRHVIEQAGDKPVLAQYIHMPVVGAIIQIDCRIGLNSRERKGGATDGGIAPAAEITN